MGQTIIEDQSFQSVDFTLNEFSGEAYERCTFINCIFINADLSRSSFMDCEFVDCDLTMAKTHNTALQSVRFIRSKLLGVQLGNCNPFLFEVSFEKCSLNLASFYRMKMKGTSFHTCNLQEADFSATDLSNASLIDCDLAGAIFDHTILEKADLRHSINYSIDPELNRIRKARFSFDGVPGLLNKYQIDIE